MMFLFKKIVSPLLLPLPIILVILVTGIFLLYFTRRQKTGKFFISAGVVLLALFSYGGISDLCLRPLEYKYPPLAEPGQFSDVKWVVVLGGGHISDPELPVTSQISDSAMMRLIEGIRIHKLLPESKLVLSGSGVFDPVPESETMANIARLLGVEENSMVLESLSMDTKDQARLISKIVKNERFILVTSASHMPRSMALFQKLGMRPIPASTDYMVKESQGISFGIFFPSTTSLQKMERVFHEYLGLGWGWIRGQI